MVRRTTVVPLSSWIVIMGFVQFGMEVGMQSACAARRFASPCPPSSAPPSQKGQRFQPLSLNRAPELAGARFPLHIRLVADSIPNRGRCQVALIDLQANRTALALLESTFRRIIGSGVKRSPRLRPTWGESSLAKGERKKSR